jgi:hypothetical protein
MGIWLHYSKCDFHGYKNKNVVKLDYTIFVVAYVKIKLTMDLIWVCNHMNVVMNIMFWQNARCNYINAWGSTFKVFVFGVVLLMQGGSNL